MASQSQVRPTSSPLVEKSHTTGIAATTSRPSGTTKASLSCSRRAARAPTANGNRRGQAPDHRRPLHAQDAAERRPKEHQRTEPQRARVRLHPLAGVEHRAVTREDLVDDAKVDEGVLI